MYLCSEFGFELYLHIVHKYFWQKLQAEILAVLMFFQEIFVNRYVSMTNKKTMENESLGYQLDTKWIPVGYQLDTSWIQVGYQLVVLQAVLNSESMGSFKLRCF